MNSDNTTSQYYNAQIKYKKIKGYLTNINYLILFLLSSCQDNYQNCLDLEYGTEYIKITGVSESDKITLSISVRHQRSLALKFMQKT